MSRTVMTLAPFGRVMPGFYRQSVDSEPVSRNPVLITLLGKFDIKWFGVVTGVGDKCIDSLSFTKKFIPSASIMGYPPSTFRDWLLAVIANVCQIWRKSVEAFPTYLALYVMTKMMSMTTKKKRQDAHYQL